MERVANAVDALQPVQLLEEELLQISNICIYHAWGLCIHPECMASHPDELCGILEDYKTWVADFWKYLSN